MNSKKPTTRSVSAAQPARRFSPKIINSDIIQGDDPQLDRTIAQQYGESATGAESRTAAVSEGIPRIESQDNRAGSKAPSNQHQQDPFVDLAPSAASQAAPDPAISDHHSTISAATLQAAGPTRVFQAAFSDDDDAEAPEAQATSPDSGPRLTTFTVPRLRPARDARRPEPRARDSPMEVEPLATVLAALQVQVSRLSDRMDDVASRVARSPSRPPRAPPQEAAPEDQARARPAAAAHPPPPRGREAPRASPSPATFPGEAAALVDELHQARRRAARHPDGARDRERAAAADAGSPDPPDDGSDEQSDSSSDHSTATGSTAARADSPRRPPRGMRRGQDVAYDDRDDPRWRHATIAPRMGDADARQLLYWFQELPSPFKEDTHSRHELAFMRWLGPELRALHDELHRDQPSRRFSVTLTERMIRLCAIRLIVLQVADTDGKDAANYLEAELAGIVSDSPVYDHTRRLVRRWRQDHGFPETVPSKAAANKEANGKRNRPGKNKRNATAGAAAPPAAAAAAQAGGAQAAPPLQPIGEAGKRRAK